MDADLRTLPRSVEPIGDQFFGIIWADGHESVYPAQYLRAHCPCASCNEKRLKARAAGGGVSLPVVGADQPAGPVSMVRYEPVGRYAVRLFWSDRHDTGIFTFELLRDLCPCDACDAERAAQRRPSPAASGPGPEPVSGPTGPGAPDPGAPDPGALAERVAALERRAMNAYRALAARFASSEAGRRFGEMAEGEAAHFAILSLAADVVRMSEPAGSPADLAALEAAAVEAAEPLVAALEAAGACGEADSDRAADLPRAVEAAVRFESQELPGVASFVAALPDRARTRTRAGLGRTLPGHYAALEALGRVAGRDDLAAAARALAARAAKL